MDLSMAAAGCPMPPASAEPALGAHSAAAQGPRPWRRRPAPLLVVVLSVALQPWVVGAQAPKDSPAMKMLQCDACRIVMKELSKDVKYLVESDKMWKTQDLEERIKVSCADPGIASGAMKDACGYMVSDYQKAIAKDITLRWTESAEEFEEDIVPVEFCRKVRICKEDHKTINEMITLSDRKEKDLKWEKEDKERSKKKATKK
mmetsp:Transcript_6468/g.13310  ORF Transcript_6468/g.13310 Transcript_6468/m.13310 type:complete len:203 (+) Transcript_6468:53-661(+)